MQDGLDEGDVPDRKWRKIKRWRLTIRLSSFWFTTSYFLTLVHADPMPNVSAITCSYTCPQTYLHTYFLTIL